MTALYMYQLNPTISPTANTIRNRICRSKPTRTVIPMSVRMSSRNVRLRKISTDRFTPGSKILSTISWTNPLPDGGATVGVEEEASISLLGYLMTHIPTGEGNEVELNYSRDNAERCEYACAPMISAYVCVFYKNSDG